MSLKTILFDLDGVLVDTATIQIDSTMQAIKEIENVDCSHNPDILNIITRTITTRNKLELMSEMKYISEENIEVIYNKKKEIADSIFELMERQEETINIMKILKQRNCNIAVVTNGNRRSALKILNAIGVTEYLDLVIANDDCIRGKPCSEPYVRAMLHFGGKLEDYLIFEDSFDGLTSARNTGAKIYHVKDISDVNTNLINNLLK